MGDPVYDVTDNRLKPGLEVASASRSALREVSPRQDRGEAGLFARLEHSGEEVRAIAGLLQAPEAGVLTGVRALEAAVKETTASGALGQARYVHFATHGILGLDVGQDVGFLGLEDGAVQLDLLLGEPVALDETRVPIVDVFENRLLLRFDRLDLLVDGFRFG